MGRKLIKTYSELIKLPTFEERFEYLRTGNIIGNAKFGSKRYLNQEFYNSKEWKMRRSEIITRDGCCDLGMPDREIDGEVMVHHINPVTEEDLINHDPILLDPENLITVWGITHRAIDYGDISLLPTQMVERTKNDTCPWRK